MKPVLRILALLLLSNAALADDAAILRCRALAESGPRLACYDAMLVGPTPATPTASKAPPALAVVPAVVASTPASTMPQQTASQFGLDQQASKTQLDSIQSRLEGKFEGWNANAKLTLANGQVWQIADGSRAYVELMNPEVSVRRGFMGAYYLDIEGSNLSPRVRRVK